MLAEKRRLIQKLRRYAKRFGPMKAERDALKRKANEHAYYVNPKRQRGQRTFRRLSVAGGYARAIKRTFGHAGAESSTGHVHLMTSRQTTVAWEKLLSANLIAQSRAFYRNAYGFLFWGHKAMLQEFARGGDRARHVLKHRHWTYELHVIRADATHIHAA